MIVPLDLIIFVILIATALLALHVQDLLAAVALLSGYSLFAALLFTGLLALDVALVEAALGAGLTGLLFIVAILATTRTTDPTPDNRRRWLVIPLLVAFFGLMVYASTGLPDRGDPDSPANQGVAATYIERSMQDTNTPNVVTSLLADYRSMDTLGETLVILTAALSTAMVLFRRVDEPTESSAPPGEPVPDSAPEHTGEPGHTEGGPS